LKDIRKIKSWLQEKRKEYYCDNCKIFAILIISGNYYSRTTIAESEVKGAENDLSNKLHCPASIVQQRRCMWAYTGG
jgi:hypothetical protein